MQNAGLDEAQAGIKIAGRNINNLRYADDTTLMAESKEELKSLLMKVKGESEKVFLKLNIQKSKITATGSITSWQMEGEKSANNDRLYFLELPNHYKMKRHLLLGKKAISNLDSVLRNRHHFAKKGPYSQNYGFSSSHVWM